MRNQRNSCIAFIVIGCLSSNYSQIISALSHGTGISLHHSIDGTLSAIRLQAECDFKGLRSLPHQCCYLTEERESQAGLMSTAPSALSALWRCLLSQFLLEEFNLTSPKHGSDFTEVCSVPQMIDRSFKITYWAGLSMPFDR